MNQGDFYQDEDGESGGEGAGDKESEEEDESEDGNESSSIESLDMENIGKRIVR